MSKPKKFKYTYHCLGCNKEFHSDKFHLYGWICAKCRSNTKLTIKCSVCGDYFQISYEYYEHAAPNKIWRCEKCNREYLSKINLEKWKNISEEEYEKECEARHQGWENMSKEDKERYINTQKEIYNNKSDEEKEDRKKFLLQIARDFYDNETEEEKENRSKIHKDIWYSQSEDAKQYQIQCGIETLNRYWNNVENESEIRSNNTKKFWNSLDKIKYEEQCKKIFESYDVFIEIYRNIALANNKDIENKIIDKDKMSITELQFLNILEENNFTYLYQYYNETIYPNFKELFPYNPYHETSNISPFHCWDFVIRLNHMDILIDIDGSIHDPNSMQFKVDNKYLISDYIKFNDSQRKYQTDNLPAFIIQCYNDKITDDCIIINLQNNTKRKLKDFIHSLIKINKNI